jgi:hypothetical protein
LIELFALAIRYLDDALTVNGTQVGTRRLLLPTTDPSGPGSDPVWIEDTGWDPPRDLDRSRAWFHYSTGRAIH